VLPSLSLSPFVEQRRTTVMLQGRARQYKNDTDFVERNKSNIVPEALLINVSAA
jgi:hypothetical protein